MSLALGTLLGGILVGILTSYQYITTGSVVLTVVHGDNAEGYTSYMLTCIWQSTWDMFGQLIYQGTSGPSITITILYYLYLYNAYYNII